MMDDAHTTQDRHKAPTQPCIRPLSLRMVDMANLDE